MVLCAPPPFMGLWGCSSVPCRSPARQPQSFCADALGLLPSRGDGEAARTQGTERPYIPIAHNPSPCARLQGFIGNSAAACRGSLSQGRLPEALHRASLVYG